MPRYYNSRNFQKLYHPYTTFRTRPYQTKQISSAFIICTYICVSVSPISYKGKSFQFEIRQLNANNKICQAGIECGKMYSVYFPIRVALLLLFPYSICDFYFGYSLLDFLCSFPLFFLLRIIIIATPFTKKEKMKVN